MNTSNYEELMSELRNEYLEGFEDKFELLRQLHSEQKWPSIELEYHKLKGTGATYGAPEVTTLCQHLEDILRNQSTIDLETLNLSIHLLGQIKDFYLKQISFNLSQHPDFLKIQKLATQAS